MFCFPSRFASAPAAPVQFLGQRRWLARITCAAIVLLSAGLLRAEKWTRVSGSKVTIYTAQVPAEAREWIVGLEAFRQHQRELFQIDDDGLELLQIVVFPNERAFRSVLDPDSPQGPGWNEVSKAYNRDGRCYVSLSPATEARPKHWAFLNATRWLTSSYRRPLPLWVTAGFEALYAEFYVEEDRVLIGARVDEAASALKDGLRVRVADMLSMRPTDSGYASANKVGNFNAQAWAAVHYMLYGEKGARRAAFQHYIGFIQEGRTQEEAFAEAFPEGTADLEKRLDRYVKSADYRVEKLPLKASELMKSITTVTPSVAEVQLALGYAHLYARGPDLAAEFFQRAVGLAPNTPAVLEAQADLALARGDEVEADAKLREAVTAGSAYYLAHLLPALRQAAAAKGMEEAADRPDGDAARAAIEALKSAIKTRPSLEVAYETIGGLVAALPEVSDDDLRALEAGRARYPNHLWIQAGYAAWQMKKKRFADAKTALDQTQTGDWQGSAAAETYVQKVQLRLQTAVNLYWMQRYLAEGQPDKALPLVPKLQDAPLLPAERAAVNEARGIAAGLESLARVKEAIAAGDWIGAQAFLEDLTGPYTPERIRQEAEKLAAEVAAKSHSS